MAWLVLGICLFVGLLLIGRWFVSADPASLARGVKWGAAGLLVMVALFLVLAGRLGLAVAAISFVLPLVMRWRALSNRFKAARGPTPNQKSGLRTATLEMSLDHDSGEMTGIVHAGAFAGRRLEDLSMEDLVALREECAARDPESVSVVETFLDRAFGSAWRAGGGAGEEEETAASRPATGPMSREEALEVLGLTEDATGRQVRDAHRRLMKRFHPDQGGSDYLAAKLNQARDVLLG
ncbi:hypothetical protein [Inquilinus sp. CAU 1745]|uniref:hypothetical protein n=1 Tax=Inquilinus sp. CAU 1745 TaxID=3140369 RepID=UPI00325AE4BA